MRVSMPVEEDAKEALAGLQQGGLVQLVSFLLIYFLCPTRFFCSSIFFFFFHGLLTYQAIDIPRETFTLAASEAGVDAGSVQSHISPSAPQYTFYHYPDSDVVIFVYTCPSGSSIKERMLYASSRMSALDLAQQHGLHISKKVCR